MSSKVRAKLLTGSRETTNAGRPPLAIEAREAIAEHGLTFEDRFGQPRARPEVAIERDNRIAFVQLVSELGLDVHEPEKPRPPVIHGNAALRVAEG